MLNNNPSMRGKEGKRLPKYKEYNKEERDEILHKIYSYRAGKEMSEKDQIERKRIFKRLGLGNHSMEKLFVKYKAQLLSVEKDQIVVHQNQDKWKILRKDDKVYLYHNNYSVASDGTRYMLPNFHLQNVYPVDKAYKVVTKIVGYRWNDHKEIYINLASCFVS